MKRTHYCCLFATLLLISAAGNLWEGIRAYRQPFPPWMTLADTWYDRLLGVFLSSSFAVCLIRYDLRKRREEKTAARPSQLWRSRVEFRIALYSAAGALLLQLPLAILKATIGAHSNDPFHQNTFWSLFQWSTVFAALFAIGMIAYDRHRLTRDLREPAGPRCTVCGYDLRATPERCPECGTAVAQTSRFSVQQPPP